MVEKWISEIKKECLPDELGMILVHNGIVRATSKKGEPVGGMNLSFDSARLKDAVSLFKTREGIADVRVWINQGQLKPGDDIMYVCLAGRFRTDVLPVFQELIALIKTEIVHEEEIA